MAKLPNPTIDAIYQSYINQNDPRWSTRLGASIIGQECRRRLWYGFRWAGRENFSGQTLRLFCTGQIEEARIIKDLRDAGCTVYDKDDEGKQFEFSSGHVVAKVDGVVEGLLESPKTPHLLEVKSANDRNFKKIAKEGCKKAKPEHYAQCQIGMGLAELTRAVYVVVNKNTDEIYLERIKFNRAEFDALMAKARAVTEADTPPDKISNDPGFFLCKFCPHGELCHGQARPQVNCRTCVHASPIKDGGWSCDKDLEMVDDCLDHILIPDLLENWAKPIDGTPEWVLYELKDGRKFLNCAGTGFPAMDVSHYASSEIVAIDEVAIGNAQVDMVREVLGGRVVSKDNHANGYPCWYDKCTGTQKRDGNKKDEGWFVFVCDTCGKTDWRISEDRS